MIDIHAHIIPALDDGPPSMDVSVALGRVAAEEGIETIISTSHSAEASREGMEGMQARLGAVREAWAAEGLNIALVLGVEVWLDFDTVAALKLGKLWTLAGSRYVLVELPYSPWPQYAEQALFDLQLSGYTPILAHPERYTAIQTDPNLLYRLSERGILAQVTAAALRGDQSPEFKKCADTLVQHRLVQFIATDAHNVKRRHRMPLLREAVDIAATLIGEQAARAMVTTNPAATLADQPIAAEPLPVESHKSFFGGLFRRDDLKRNA